MTKTTQDLTRLEHTWLEAAQQKDRATLERLLAPEFVYTASNHGRRSRQELLAMGTRYDITRFEFVEMEVRDYGDAAVVVSHYRQEATVAGVPRNGDFLFTDVWVRRGDGWQAVARSSVMQSVSA
jgi:ketosteroid isomerase-like protein